MTPRRRLLSALASRCSLAFGPICGLEGHALALFQGLEARHVDGREVCEDVLSALVANDESESLAVVEPQHCPQRPLDRAGSVEGRLAMSVSPLARTCRLIAILGACPLRYNRTENCPHAGTDDHLLPASVLTPVPEVSRHHSRMQPTRHIQGSLRPSLVVGGGSAVGASTT